MNRPDLLNHCFLRDSNMVFRKIADEFLLVPICQDAADLGKIYLLNEVGGRIWELLDGQRRGRDIKDIIAGEFEVSVEEAENDIVEFLQKLLAIGALRDDMSAHP
jgi:hypothetical protein